MASDVFLQQKKERYSKFGLDSHILHTRTLHIHSLSLSSSSTDEFVSNTVSFYLIVFLLVKEMNFFP
jgi:hypothetical protein